MSHIVERLESSEDIDIIWKITTFAEFCIGIMQHYCFHQSFQNGQIQSKQLKLYSSLCATFATLSAIVSCISSIVCAQWQCWMNSRMYILTILLYNTYALAQIFLYLISIGRLFNPFYARIYEYPKYFQYLLWFLLTIYTMALMALDIELGLMWSGIDVPYSIDEATTAVYCITDIVLSILCTLKIEERASPQHRATDSAFVPEQVLPGSLWEHTRDAPNLGMLPFRSEGMVGFFRPICCGNAVNQNVYLAVARRFCAISALQFISAVLAHSLWLGSMLR